MLFSEIVPVYLQARTVNGLAVTTVNWYGWLLRRYARWLEREHHQDDWTEMETIEAYIADCRKELKPVSVSSTYTTLNVFFEWLAKRKVISGQPNPHLKLPNPMADIPMQRPPRAKPRVTEVEDYDRLQSSIADMEHKTWVDLRDLLAIRVLYLCGLRAFEVVGLEARDFRLDSDVLIVRSGKGGDDRPAPLLPAVTDAFVYYSYARPVVKHDKLFVSSYSNEAARESESFTTSGLRQMLVRRCEVAGVAYLNPHSFRHGLAMRLLNKGGDMSLVQKVLGHAQIGTTATYYAKWLTNPMIEKFRQIME